MAYVELLIQHSDKLYNAFM